MRRLVALSRPTLSGHQLRLVRSIAYSATRQMSRDSFHVVISREQIRGVLIFSFPCERLAFHRRPGGRPWRPRPCLRRTPIGEVFFRHPLVFRFEHPALATMWSTSPIFAILVTECATAQFSAVIAYSIPCPTRVSASTQIIQDRPSDANGNIDCARCGDVCGGAPKGTDPFFDRNRASPRQSSCRQANRGWPFGSPQFPSIAPATRSAPLRGVIEMRVTVDGRRWPIGACEA